MKIHEIYKKNIQKLKKIYAHYHIQKKTFFSHTGRKYIFIILLICAICYGIIFFLASRLETVASFPGILLNTLETTHPEILSKEIEGAEKIIIEMPGEEIHGIFLNNNSEKTVYYFHGNGGDISFFSEDIKYISDLGYNILAIEYPGYGDSTGFPFEEKIMEYTENLYIYAQETYNITQENTIVWGYSIGTGVATQFAQNKNIDSLILVASYTSRYDLSTLNYGFPLQKLFLLPNSFETLENIKNVSAQKLIIHGTQDALVPFSQGKENFESADGNKFFIEIDGGDHYDALEKENVQVDIENFLKYKTLDTALIEEIKRKEFLERIDMVSDDSIYKYVDSKISFTTKSYIPQDMRALSREYISDTKGNAQMREEAAGNFESLAEAFFAEFKEKVVVVSSYRSYSYQAGIKAGGCPDNLCAKAGYSEHQSGLTADLWSASSNAYWKSSPALMKKYDWLDENAYKYGFENSYQNGVSIDGYEIEPWHWRYLGKELAEHLHNNNMTFAQYYYGKVK